MSNFLDPLPIASMAVLAFNAIKPSIHEQIIKMDKSYQYKIDNR